MADLRPGGAVGPGRRLREHPRVRAADGLPRAGRGVPGERRAVRRVEPNDIRRLAQDLAALVSNEFS